MEVDWADVSFILVNPLMFSDAHGRYDIIVGKLFTTPPTLPSIYGPTWDNPQNFKSLFSLFPDLHSHQLILGGDFNCVLHAQLDRLKPKLNCRPLQEQLIPSSIPIYCLTNGG